MNAVTPQERPASLMAGGSIRPIVPQSFEEAWRIANAVCTAGMAPKDLETPEKAMIAIMHGLEVGLTPMAALQSIAVVNGRPTIWGDGALGLVQGSGKMESHKETFTGEGEQRKATCVVKRRGNSDVTTGEFSVTSAKKAGLWGKSGPWSQYPDRMLMMRARGFALRDAFSDVLRGLGIAEEVQDTPVDITPKAPPAPPEPPTYSEPEQENNAVPDKQLVEDAIVEDVTDEFDANQFFTDLEAELGVCPTVEDLEDAWSARDPLAVFDGDDVNISIAKAIKARRLMVIGATNGKR